MNRYGIEVSLKNSPELDPGFFPLQRFNEAFLAEARKPIGIAVERAGGQMASVSTFIHGTPEMADADRYYIERLVKTILWMKGGFRVMVCGDDGICDYLKAAYREGGQQAFDADFMSKVFEHPFEVLPTEQLPAPHDEPKAVGGHLSGCRIGFDAGGSDRKVSAVIDGEEHLPRVDAVGVSSAGIYINNRTMNASLFLQVPQDLFEKKVKDIYIRAITDTFGNIPYSVINDGDVTALAGAMSLETNNVLGIAMGTSEAAGFVDPKGRITGWLNELAFVPVDANPDAMRDEWSGDIGCGVKYFSQDGIIKLAPAAGIELDESLSPAEKLKVVQKLMETGDERAAAIYRSLGCCLAHTLAYYYALYGCENLLLLGRVMSGKGGDVLLDTCKAVLADEYPSLAAKLRLALPDEKFRRVGQSAVAASLPEV